MNEEQAPEQAAEALESAEVAEVAEAVEQKAPRTIHVADVDADGIYRGVKQIAAAEATAADIEVPPDCDLAPGAYKLAANGKRFDPLPVDVKAPPVPPSALNALYALCRTQAAAGHPLHPATRDWMDTYGKTVDAQGLTF